MLSRFFMLVFLFYSVNAELAPFITKCQADDEKCARQTAQNAIPIFAAGIPQLGVDQMDPFYMKKLDASSKGLKLYLQDISGTGLKDCIAKKIKRDTSASKIIVKLQCNVEFVGKYEMGGKLLVLSIDGKGDARVVLNKLVIVVEADIGETNGKDGLTHWTIKGWDHQFDVKEKSLIELSNLFNGNEVLAYAARQLIATSSNDIIKEVGPPIVKAIAERIIDNVERFFSNVPASELSLN